MKIVVTGYKGFLGSRLYSFLGKKYEVFGLGRQEADITNLASVREYFMNIKPDAVVHCAAIGDTAKCEEDKDMAYKVNVIGTRNIATCCEDFESRMIYISTDQVYDYTLKEIFREYSEAKPLNFYGKTKMLAEEDVRTILNKFHICRISWQYDHHLKLQNEPSRGGLLNLINSNLTLGQKIKYNPNSRRFITYVFDTTDVIESMLLVEVPYGTYNVASENSLTDYEIKELILTKMGIEESELNTILEEENGGIKYLLPEPYALKHAGYFIPSFEDGLERCFKENK